MPDESDAGVADTEDDSDTDEESDTDAPTTDVAESTTDVPPQGTDGGTDVDEDTSTSDPPVVCESESVRACEIEGWECGEQSCEDGQWGDCTETELCDGGDSTTTPLVLSFGDAQPRLVESMTSIFDNDGAGSCESTDWPTATTPWLAMDRDGDGGIADGRELFGSGTRLVGGSRAEHGFAALGELDGDGNGRITPADPRFAELLVWADDDGDKRGTGAELRSLADLRVLAIDLRYAKDRVCDERGNCGVERAELVFVGTDGAIATGSVIDVHLACR
ncbi:MAG: calcium-binding protein [Deltaproteobacteria bacterium]|nr:calcium-binding protein [Nannocystaceae bacterium]